MSLLVWCTTSNSGIFEVREVDAVFIFSGQAVLCSGVTFLIVLETVYIHMSAHTKKDIN
jgi:hypothetical protein